jgi:hypothetical protein
MGPTHLDDERWAGLNFIENGILLLLLLGSGTLLLYRSRQGMMGKMREWQNKMKIPPDEGKENEEIKKDEAEVKNIPASEENQENNEQG